MTLLIDKSKKFKRFFDQSEKPRDINFLVLHHIEANSLNHAIEQLVEHQVSAHFMIDVDGSIFELVDENDIAYHAGVSYWNGCEGLNKSSIGIEFVNADVATQPFSTQQMISGVMLAKYLIAKYNIKPENVVGHSDIAYDKETGLLDRKQDPSALFDWQFFADNGVGNFKGVWADVMADVDINEFALGDQNEKIKMIKTKLKHLGYKVENGDDRFDIEMQHLINVFQRRFS